MKSLNKEYVKKSLYGRLWGGIIHIVLLVLLLVIASNIIYYYSNNIFYQKCKDDLLNYSKYVVSIDKINSDKGYKMPNMYVLYFDKNGNVDLENGFVPSSMGVASVNVGINLENLEKVRHVKYKNDFYITILLNHEKSNGYIKIFSCINQTMDASYYTNYGLIWIVVGMFAIAIVLAVVETIYSVKPYRETMVKMGDFMSNMTHEFGTPLAIIQASVESVLAKENFDEDSEQYNRLSTVINEVKRLKKMTGDFILITKYDNKAVDSNVKSVVVENEINNIIEAGCLLAEAQDKEMDFMIRGESRNVIVDIDKLKQCVIALMDNAIKYTTEGCKINIRLIYNKFYYVIEVQDNGESVPEKDLKKLFDRFYRTDKVRASSTTGSGLGLSIVSCIVNNLNGKIIAENVEPRGFKVSMYLPNDCTKVSNIIKLLHTKNNKKKK